MKNKWGAVVITIFLICLASLSLWYGFYLMETTKPSYIYVALLDEVDINISEILNQFQGYYIGDNYTVSGSVDYNLDSEDLSKNNPNDSKYKFIKNLSNLTTTFSIKHDDSNNKMLFEVKEDIYDENILNYKLLIDNSTLYTFNGPFSDKYINMGSSNYFEIIDEENNNLNNYTYLHDIIIKAMKENISDEDLIVDDVKTNVGSKEQNVKRISLSINDKFIRKYYNSIIDYLNGDSRAKKILDSISPDILTKKLGDEDYFFTKSESYTFNIYTDKNNKPLKYDLLHLYENDKYVYSYEGNFASGVFYYVKNDQVINIFNCEKAGNIFSCSISNNLDEKLGDIKFESSSSNISFNYNYDDKTINKDYVLNITITGDNKSFEAKGTLNLKEVENLLGKINGEVTFSLTGIKDVSIKEDVSESLLWSTLEEDKKYSFNNIKSIVKERLER